MTAATTSAWKASSDGGAWSASDRGTHEGRNADTGRSACCWRFLWKPLVRTGRTSSATMSWGGWRGASVEAAAAHLDDFATLVRLALVCGRPRPRARPWRCCIQLALPVALLQFSQVAGHRLAVGPHRQLAWLPDFFTRPKYLFHYIFRPCLFMSCLHRVMINIFPTIYSYYIFFIFCIVIANFKLFNCVLGIFYAR